MRLLTAVLQAAFEREVTRLAPLAFRDAVAAFMAALDATGLRHAVVLERMEPCATCGGVGKVPGPALPGPESTDAARALVICPVCMGSRHQVAAPAVIGGTAPEEISFVPGDWPAGAAAKMVRVGGNTKQKNTKTGEIRHVMTYQFAPSVERVIVVRKQEG